MYLNSLLTIGRPFRSVRNHQVSPSLDKGDMFHFQETAILSRVGLQHFKMVTMRIKTMETVNASVLHGTRTMIICWTLKNSYLPSHLPVLKACILYSSICQ